MSTIQVKEFFAYNRVRVTEQDVDVQNQRVTIKLKPDERYTPRCYKCKGGTGEIHSLNELYFQRPEHL